MYEDAYNLSQDALNRIQRKKRVQEASGRIVNPWEYQKDVEAELNALNDQKAKMRSLGISEKMLGVKEGLLAETIRKNTADYDLGKARLDMGVSEGALDRAAQGSEAGADRDLKLLLSTLNNNFATSQAALNRDFLDTQQAIQIAAGRDLSNMKSGYSDQAGLYNFLGSLVGAGGSLALRKWGK